MTNPPSPGVDLRRLFDFSVIGIVISTDAGAVIEANDAFLEMVGYARDDVLRGTLDWRALTPPEWIPDDERAIDELARTGRFTQYEKEYFRQDGSRVPIVIGGARLGDSHDEMVCYALDLSQQKAAVRALTLSEQRYRTLADALPHIVMIADAERRLVYANRRYEDVTGIPSDEFGARWREAIHPDDLPAVERVRASGEPYEIEYRLRCAADGAYRWHFARVQRVATDSIAWLASAMDIHDRKVAEERLSVMYEREHRVASVLQEAALPRTLPDVRGFALDAHYRAGRDEASIGGDWFDAIVVDDERLIVSVGDVAGSGLQAAVSMGNVRQLLRGAAHASIDPLAMLDIADRTLRSERNDAIVTAFIGVIDIVQRRMRYASAGHVPALLRTPDGEVRALYLPGLPLGCRDMGSGESASVDLPPGSSLLLYTDGLVEWSRDIVEGQERLRSCFATASGAGAQSARELVNRVIDGAGTLDDIAVLIVHLDEES